MERKNIRREKIDVICYYVKQQLPQPIRIRSREHVIPIHRVDSVEERHFSGIPILEYRCTAFGKGKKHTMKLQYQIDEMAWTMREFT